MGKGLIRSGGIHRFWLITYSIVACHACKPSYDHLRADLQRQVSFVNQMPGDGSADFKAIRDTLTPAKKNLKNGVARAILQANLAGQAYQRTLLVRPPEWSFLGADQHLSSSSTAPVDSVLPNDTLSRALIQINQFLDAANQDLLASTRELEVELDSVYSTLYNRQTLLGLELNLQYDLELQNSRNEYRKALFNLINQTFLRGKNNSTGQQELLELMEELSEIK